MNHRLNRRLFLKRAAAAAGALSAAQFLPGPNLLRAASPGEKLRCALIGCGGRGLSAHLGPASNQVLRAIVDVNEKQFGAVKKALEGKGKDAGDLQTFTDYRVMFDKMGKEID